MELNELLASLDLKNEDELWATLTEEEKKAFMKSVQTGMVMEGAKLSL